MKQIARSHLHYIASQQSHRLFHALKFRIVFFVFMLLLVLTGFEPSPLLASGTAAIGCKLTWGPPSLVNPTTINLTTTTSQQVVNMDPNKDYIIRMPQSAVRGNIALVGGHNVVLIGGEISIPWKGDTATVTDRTALKIKNATGTVHIEGLLARGSDISEGINIEAPQAVVQIENVRIENIHARDQVSFRDSHPDLIQPYGNVRQLRVDRFTGSTDYQGLTMKADYNGPLGAVYIRNTNIIGRSTARYMWWVDPNPLAGQISLSNVWLDVHSTRFGGLGQSVWPNIYASAPNKALIAVDGSGYTYATWSPLMKPQISGRITEGMPPGGDFVPSGSVGIGYVSPGYGTTSCTSTNTLTTFDAIALNEMASETLMPTLTPDATTLNDRLSETPVPPLAEIQAEDPLVVRNSEWMPLETVTDASGGSVLINAAMDASLTFTFSGSHAEIAAVNGPSFGNYNITLDNNPPVTVNTTAEITSIVRTPLSFTQGIHTLKITPFDSVVGIDAFYIDGSIITSELPTNFPIDITPEVTFELLTPRGPVALPVEILPSQTPAVPSSLLPYTLPLYLTMDDGAPVWSHTAGWSLSGEGAFRGLGWTAAATGTIESLSLAVPVALSNALLPRLRIETRFTDVSAPEVQISRDGVTWTTLAVFQRSDEWMSAEFNLGAYAGQTIFIQFVWSSPLLGDNVNEPVWQLDELMIFDASLDATPTETPTMMPSDILPTTELPMPELTDVLLTEVIQPTLVPTEVVQPTLVPSPMLTEVPPEMPTSIVIPTDLPAAPNTSSNG